MLAFLLDHCHSSEPNAMELVYGRGAMISREGQHRGVGHLVNARVDRLIMCQKEVH